MAFLFFIGGKQGEAGLWPASPWRYQTRLLNAGTGQAGGDASDEGRERVSSSSTPQQPERDHQAYGHDGDDQRVFHNLRAFFVTGEIDGAVLDCFDKFIHFYYPFDSVKKRIARYLFRLGPTVLRPSTCCKFHYGYIRKCRPADLHRTSILCLST